MESWLVGFSFFSQHFKDVTPLSSGVRSLLSFYLDCLQDFLLVFGFQQFHSYLSRWMSFSSHFLFFLGMHFEAFAYVSFVSSSNIIVPFFLFYFAYMASNFSYSCALTHVWQRLRPQKGLSSLNFRLLGYLENLVLWWVQWELYFYSLSCIFLFSWWKWCFLFKI